MEKKWEVKGESRIKNQESRDREIIEQLLANRGLETEEEIGTFFNPPSPQAFLDSQNLIDRKRISRAVRIINNAIDQGWPIFVWGDYDVDGLCGTAILWEAIYRDLRYKNVRPYIPDRFSEGYGLSIQGLEESKKQDKSLLITTDCGITSVEKVKYAKDLGFEVIITDHHQKGETLPEADAILWTENLSGAGIAWVLASQVTNQRNQLDLIALATIADLQPLLDANRTLVKAGLEELNKLERPGVKALAETSGLQGKRIGTYEIGWMLAPRLNAAGRLDTAMDALRLLCTRNYAQAEELAQKLSQINKERQDQTKENFAHAKDSYQDNKILILHHDSYHEGVIGLVAGRLVQKFHRPAIVISRGEELSKGSARSISAFNIIEAVRQTEHILEDAGGHPMAAGFTIRTEKIEEFSRLLLDYGGQVLSDDDLRPTIKIDCEINFLDISWELWEELKKFEPHGIGNPRPLFLTRGVKVLDSRTVGSESRHLKLLVSDPSSFISFRAIAFGFGDRVSQIRLGDRLDVVYSVQENVWNGNRNLELVIKDLRL